MKYTPVIIIDPDHPLYSTLLELMKVYSVREDEEAAAAQRILDIDFDWDKLVEDYNSLRSQEILAFLAYGPTFNAKLHQFLLRRGLSRKLDFKVQMCPVPAMESLHAIAGTPTDEIPEGEFADYACIKGKLYPDPKAHPHVAAMDAALPRRSNRHATSDTIPVIRDLHQVYILKMTTKKAKAIRRPGRPKRKNK